MSTMRYFSVNRSQRYTGKLCRFFCWQDYVASGAVGFPPGFNFFQALSG
ncbi:TPA: hypothetical protein MC769_003169 [Klebsiella aerogenes]|nr:hypothetical protein [Klebsiella aerogenes]